VIDMVSRLVASNERECHQSMKRHWMASPLSRMMYSNAQVPSRTSVWPVLPRRKPPFPWASPSVQYLRNSRQRPDPTVSRNLDERETRDIEPFNCRHDTILARRWCHLQTRPASKRTFVP
jgi:hypothetical protein